MNTFESNWLVDRSCFTKGLVVGALTAPKILFIYIYIFLYNLITKHITHLKRKYLMKNINKPKKNEPNVTNLNATPKLSKEITRLHKSKWQESKLPKFARHTYMKLNYGKVNYLRLRKEKYT